MEQKLIELYQEALVAGEMLNQWHTASGAEEVAKAKVSRLVGFAMALGTKHQTED